ncbi:acyl-CoA dehydrogenase family protein [Epilithonimonas arachidiradicis]|uniref:Acyl-CoA dehydrogenase n=1 Tax=Epilithonimonas arachidiradicis TaxID=1617282 RepID=A0A420D827_9FLAO|nr:acyl-CoA dehydrogenase family protein [Epilithonimonas arachidiradicis]RKE86724.1 alkylation response protein AidB-like acyl-CoA dehydrogenase [Epilithonimonas arachidiradicis]GGG62451.1 acyl-CoA dehydrogenase [Epilithonimonas arachidiradicis]
MNALALDASVVSYPEFLSRFKSSLSSLFQKENIDELSLSRGLPPNVWKEILNLKPLSVSIPKEFGGRGAKVKECLGVLSAAAYESLPLSLTFGINIALFLEPLAKYGNEIIKGDIFKHFLDFGAMGGLMITEPDFGSDALNMKTQNELKDNTYHIKGTKHWQGLTGLANYWLVTSRNINADGNLARDVDFFVADTHKPEQNIEVLEYYDNPGLYMIPYGLNKVDIKVPEYNKLIPETTGLKMMLDILHRSRFQFPGMGMGFLKRMMDEAMKHCKERIVGTCNLFSLDQVQYQIAKLQSFFALSSAMCAKSTSVSGIDKDVSASGVHANSMKAFVTDMMQEAAQMLVQLSGAKGYRTSHIGGRGIMDSRPFQIFEGSNEMLYTQISEGILKDMKKKKTDNLGAYLSINEITKEAAKLYAKELDVTINGPLSQRKMIDLGKIISRVVTVNDLIELNEAGFNQELTDNSIEIVRQEIVTLFASFQHHKAISALDDISDKSDWMTFF